MSARPTVARALLAAAALAVSVAVGPAVTAGATGPAADSASAPAGGDAPARAAADPRKRLGLFADPLLAANQQGPAYRSIARKPQALWLGNESYPTDRVRGVVEAYAGRAAEARGTPVLVVYSIPDRDCGQHSSGGLAGAAEYRAWVKQVARGVRGSKPLVVLEPDAIAFIGNAGCEDAGDRVRLLRFAVKKLTAAGAWVYLDAGHSNWPDPGRALLLKRAGVGLARGIATNVSNFRTLADETAYADRLRAELKQLGIRGVKHVVDSSRNGAADPVGGDVINPTWARLGRAPKLIFDGGFDGTLWIKHPGESDGSANGGNDPGQWCDLLADRLLGQEPTAGC
ncbi:glycoside hydrolase family 6 protein [Nocardioides sp. SYSU DS0663]|uniref:glycoside hydrolase family 6 protein n=1 Tax=Nocardioides sp. SYSU DS0663 TaxID=3416445 RepID=UPI003F4C761C